MLGGRFSSLLAALVLAAACSRSELDLESGVAQGVDPGPPEDASEDVAADAPEAGDGDIVTSDTITFVSGPDWESLGGPGGNEDLGPAQEVCVNAGIPSNCPAGAVDYGSVATGGWSVFDGQPDVRWIWLAGVEASQVSDGVLAGFRKTFTVGANATGQIQVGVDDYATVFVNQTAVGSLGSTSDESMAWTAQTVGRIIDLSPALREGENTITVVAQNGPASYAGCASACTYASNTAGVAFAGTITW